MSPQRDAERVRSGARRYTPKYRRVADALRERITSGAVGVGESLPPMKALAEEFGVSLMTVFRAVRLLNDDGLVSTSQSRTGTVVIRSRPQPSTTAPATIACLLRHHRRPRTRSEVDNFLLDMVDGIRAEISQQEYRFIYHGLDENEYDRRVLELVEQRAVCGCLLDQETPLSLIERVAESGIPTVLVNRIEDVPGLCSVCPDYEAAARKSAEFLLRKGYERLAFYKCVPGEEQWTEDDVAQNWPLLAKRRGFLEAAEECGFGEEDVAFIPEPADSAAAQEPAAYGLPRSRPKDWKPLGIVSASDNNASYIVNAVKKTSLGLGEDVGVISCLELEGGLHSPTPPTTWRIDPAFIGRTAVRELLLRVDGPHLPACQLRIAMDFVEKGTA